MSNSDSLDYFEPYDCDDPVYIAVMEFRDAFLVASNHSLNPDKLSSLACRDGEQLAAEFSRYVCERADEQTVEAAKLDGCLWQNVLLKQ